MHFFLSYRSKEMDFALRLANDLKSRGVPIWMDVLSTLGPGDDWQQTLQRAIDECSGLIAVLSPDYVKSKYCYRELLRADRLGRPIFPVLLKDVGIDLPFALDGVQYGDFREWQIESVYQAKLTQLVTKLMAIGIQPSTMSLLSNSIPTALPPIKLAEDRIEGILTQTQNLPTQRLSVQLHIKTLQGKLDIAVADYTEISEQYLGLVDPEIRNAYDRKMQMLLKRIDAIENEFASLNAPR